MSNECERILEILSPLKSENKKWEIIVECASKIGTKEWQ